MNTMSTNVPSVVPSKPLEKKLTKSPSPPFSHDEEASDSNSLPPLPDVVLCSALSASILHGQRLRERRRHKAAVQTRGRQDLEQLEVEDMMEPLVRSLQDVLHTTVSLHPDPAREEQLPIVSHKKRSRTTSNSSATTATKLSLLSAVVSSSTALKKDSLNIEDTPEGVFNGLKNLFKNVFAH